MAGMIMKLIVIFEFRFRNVIFFYLTMNSSRVTLDSMRGFVTPEQKVQSEMGRVASQIR